MCIGISIKVIDIEDIKLQFGAAPKDFAKFFLTKRELSVLSDLTVPIHFLAKRIAAKEALIEALGLDHPLSYQEIEIDHDQLGRPFIKTKKNIGDIHLSLTDEGNHIAALVVIESFF